MSTAQQKRKPIWRPPAVQARNIYRMDLIPPTGILKRFSIAAAEKPLNPEGEGLKPFGVGDTNLCSKLIGEKIVKMCYCIINKSIEYWSECFETSTGGIWNHVLQ